MILLNGNKRKPKAPPHTRTSNPSRKTASSTTEFVPAPPPWEPYVFHHDSSVRQPTQPVNHSLPIPYAGSPQSHSEWELNYAISDGFDRIIATVDQGTPPLGDDEDKYTIIVTENTDFPSYQQTRSISSPQILSRANRGVGNTERRINILGKISKYSNLRLPPELPPLRVYIPTWPMICLASQYSQNTYHGPSSSHEREYFVSADGRLGTKAMVMRLLPCDDKKTIVFAIRGTSMFSLRDWGVNLNYRGASPAGFLDDDGNICHSGFLKVAKAMIAPIAARLRTLLEENPSRASCSLLITGHSAGGAVASLLFGHMLSQHVQSELNILTGCFKRVHCITFGAPPISLMPITKSSLNIEHQHRKSLFFSFINEGDPVARCDATYAKSLITLLASPTPSIPPTKHANESNNKLSKMHLLSASMSRLDLRHPLPSPQPFVQSQPTSTKDPVHKNSPSRKPVWILPPAEMYNAGRLVLLRMPEQPALKKSVSSQQWETENLAKLSAHTVTDDQLQGVVFGDPSMHAMSVYARRIEMLALKAVTARS